MNTKLERISEITTVLRLAEIDVNALYADKEAAESAEGENAGFL